MTAAAKRVDMPLNRLTILGALILLLVAAGLALIVLRGPLKKDSTSADAATFEVAQGPLTISVAESGTIKASEQVIIKSEVEGRTTILYLIPEGTRVKEGELLIELDASQLHDQKVDQEIRVQNAEAAFIRSRENLEVVKNQALSDVDKAELTLQFAREDLKKYLEGEYPNERKELEVRITLAEADVQRTEEKAKWSRKLFEEKYLSQAELQGDELEHKRAQLDLELARNNLALLQDYTYKRKLAELESDGKQAEMALERTKRKARADVVQAEADLRAKESEFRRQKTKLDKLGEQIAKTRITAPTDALVVYATSARANWRGNSTPLDEGQEVREREELIYLPTASTFVVEVKVHESNLEKIAVGLPARLSIDALPGRQFTGRVTRIAPLPDAQSMWMNPDLKVYRTEVLIDGDAAELRTGMSCRTEIIVAHYEDAVYVPVQSVVRVNGTPTVYVLKQNEQEAREVDVGLDNNRMVHITGGLEPGELVLLAPPLADAAAVEPQNAEPAAAELSQNMTPEERERMRKGRAAREGSGRERSGTSSPE